MIFLAIDFQYCLIWSTYTVSFYEASFAFKHLCKLFLIETFILFVQHRTENSTSSLLNCRSFHIGTHQMQTLFLRSWGFLIGPFKVSSSICITLAPGF